MLYLLRSARRFRALRFKGRRPQSRDDPLKRRRSENVSRETFSLLIRFSDCRTMKRSGVQHSHDSVRPRRNRWRAVLLGAGGAIVCGTRPGKFSKTVASKLATGGGR